MLYLGNNECASSPPLKHIYPAADFWSRLEILKQSSLHCAIHFSFIENIAFERHTFSKV